MKITGAIFDMDGTLLDSMDYWAIAAGEYLNSLGIFPEDNTNRRFLEDGMKSWYEYCVVNCGLTREYDEVKRGIYAYMDEKYKTVVKLKDGALDMLKRLREAGVKMCLATATDRKTVEMTLERLGIDVYFSRIFTTAEVGAGKRQPLIYERALEYLGTDRETTYIFEDAYYALSTTHKNGFKAVGVYDKNVFATKEEVRALCDYYLDEHDRYYFELE